MTPTAHDRIDNYHGSEHCKLCADGGLVVATRRNMPPAQPRFNAWIKVGDHAREHPRKPAPTMLDEMGPCPRCDRGYRVEFGIGVRRNRNGEITDHNFRKPEGGPWGKEGYWRGRDPVGLEAEPPITSPKVDRDAAEHARELAAAIGVNIQP